MITPNLLSLCMIVKNEAALLPRALDNLYDFYDELIVVDTGSTDETEAIAHNYGATVLHYEWQEPGHKGEARNVGLDAATSEWVMVLDADEVVREPYDLRKWLETLEEHFTGVLLSFENYAPDEAVILRWMQLRLFKNGLYRYVHREHEYPQFTAMVDEYLVGTTHTIEHRPPAERAEPKTAPMLERLKLDVAERPEDAHSLYFLHRQWLHAGKWEKALEVGERFLAVGNGMRPACYGNMSYCEVQLGNLPKAIEWLHLALSEQPQRRYWWIRVAELYMTLEAWNTALAYLRGAGEVWQQHNFEREPVVEERQFGEMVAKCQAAIAGSYHTH